LLLPSDTTTPPEPAALDSVTVQVVAAPVWIAAGTHANDARRVGATREIEAVLEAPLSVAAITAVVSPAMVPAVAVKVAEEAPAATVAVGGTLRAPALLESEIPTPPGPAAWVRPTVQVAAWPDARADGWHVRLLTVAVAASTVREAVCEVPLKVAVTVAAVSLATVPAVAVKAAETAPAGTVTVGGTLSAGALLDSRIAAPGEPAALESVNVQVDVAPDGTLSGMQDNEFSTADDTRVRDAVWTLPLKVAAITAL